MSALGNFGSVFCMFLTLRVSSEKNLNTCLIEEKEVSSLCTGEIQSVKSQVSNSRMFFQAGSEANT